MATSHGIVVCNWRNSYATRPWACSVRIAVWFCGRCQAEDKWFPPLIETPWVQDETALVEILFRGVSGTIYVQNKRYASFMSPYGREISDEQLLLIIKYIREDLNSYEPTQSDIENIGEMRKKFNDSPPIRGNQELNSILTQSK